MLFFNFFPPRSFFRALTVQYIQTVEFTFEMLWKLLYLHSKRCGSSSIYILNVAEAALFPFKKLQESVALFTSPRWVEL
jgi:hypothetical protein